MTDRMGAVPAPRAAESETQGAAAAPRRLRMVLVDPGRTVGGTNVLMSRLARSLKEEHEVSVAVIDFEDGFLATEGRRLGVEVRRFQAAPRPSVAADEVLLAPLSHLWMLQDAIVVSRQTKVIFWNVHPNNALVLSPLHHQLARMYPERAAIVLKVLQPGLRRRVRRLLEDLSNAGGLLEMDGEVHRSHRVLFGTRTKPRFIPIPVPVGSSELPGVSAKEQGGSTSRLGWLGRLSVDKVPTLIATLKAANDLARRTNQQFEFHIIGEGSQAARVARAVRECDRLSCVMAGTLQKEALSTYLKSKIDVMFAMGTSCLEAARLGMPAVLVDAALWRIPPEEIRFCWLFDTKKFCLGRIWSPYRTPYSHSLGDILMATESPESRKTLGQACEAYCRAHHDLTSVTRALVSAAEACECTPDTVKLMDVLRLRGMDRAFVLAKKAWKSYRNRIRRSQPAKLRIKA